MKTKEYFRKNGKKVFTNNKKNNIIKTIYNPLKVNCKIYKRGSGLFMKETNEVLEDKNKLNLKEFTNKRIMENVNLFSKEELTILRNNKTLIEKIYIWGLLDGI